MTYLTKKQGKRMGAILVQDKIFLSPEDAERYWKESSKPGGVYKIVAYLKKKRWYEFWK